MPRVAELANVSYAVNGQQILRDVSLDIEAGETVCLIGESGCGKTVSLKLMVGLLQPTSGHACLFEQNLATCSAGTLQTCYQRLGFLFQGGALFDSLTVAENIAYPLIFREHLTPAEQEREVRARLAEVGLPESTADKRPAELSGGMQKRVALARALVHRPELICYDEPTTGLDPVMTQVINDLIIQTRDHHPVTSIVVTHELSTIRRVATRIIMLQTARGLAEGESQVVFDGRPAEFWQSPHPAIVRFTQQTP